MRIVVTGATGYIGTRLMCLALKHNHHVTVVSRRQPASYPVDWIPWEMSSRAIELPAETDAVVHLAAKTAMSHEWSDQTEVMAARVLTEAAQKVRSKFIFVSSQTARPNAPTSYGRTKWRIEQDVLAAGGLVVRPGLVYGAHARGLFGTLVDIVGNAPILPAFVPAPKVQPIHVDDLAEGLLRIVEGSDSSCHTYALAAPKPVSFTYFLHEIASSRLRCRRMFLPVPTQLIMVLSRALERLRMPQWGIERLRSLFDLPVMETASDLNRLGIFLRPLCSGMHLSGSVRRRRVLQEGWALLTYVLRKPPGSAVLRRYVRMIDQLRDGEALGLPELLLRYPALLSLIGDSAWGDTAAQAEFSWRMDAATLLGEATPAGGDRFLGLGRDHGMFGRLYLVVKAVACEVIWRGLGTIGLPLVRVMLDRARAAL